MTLPKACIFDLDGVIVDTVPAHFVAWKAMADELNIPFTEVDNEQLKGVSRTESMKRILAMGGMTKSNIEIEEMTTKKNHIYVEIISKMTPDDILPGVVEFLDLLDDNNIAIALGSSSKNAPVILEAVGLAHRFPVSVDGNQIAHSKPHPEVFLLGADRLGLSPSECVVFEDAISGVQAAKRGNFKCVGVGDSTVLSEADVVIPDMKNIDLTIFDNL
ncbi:beta-phosphoglucomutase [Roseivirga spongicola]|uniref:Beta-phosphoglucomutase n=1 Tax=Roseivirga spongicola TaxID=333140 RepID=A0A150X4T2_9BACT|nr:beta-phosphoglucomutase [Roseivirga spongicola]KYG73708.1 beta-phosphoglucomutase [Roseivirga spongicola]WPZ09661.1 beta-phosphoglucomutase [Roseivirga spongicola]